MRIRAAAFVVVGFSVCSGEPMQRHIHHKKLHKKPKKLNSHKPNSLLQLKRSQSKSKDSQDQAQGPPFYDAFNPMNSQPEIFSPPERFGYQPPPPQQQFSNRPRRQVGFGGGGGDQVIMMPESPRFRIAQPAVVSTGGGEQGGGGSGSNNQGAVQASVTQPNSQKLTPTPTTDPKLDAETGKDNEAEADAAKNTENAPPAPTGPPPTATPLPRPAIRRPVAPPTFPPTSPYRSRSSLYAVALINGAGFGNQAWAQMRLDWMMNTLAFPFIAAIANGVSWAMALKPWPFYLLFPPDFKVQSSVPRTLIYHLQRLAAQYIKKQSTGGLETFVVTRWLTYPILLQSLPSGIYWVSMMITTWLICIFY